MKIKSARADSDDDVPLGVHLAMKMLVDHSEPGPESEREDKIKAAGRVGWHTLK
jgi:hypothetical protein